MLKIQKWVGDVTETHFSNMIIVQQSNQCTEVIWGKKKDFYHLRLEVWAFIQIVVFVWEWNLSPPYVFGTNPVDFVLITKLFTTRDF